MGWSVLESVLEHVGYEPCQERAGHLKTGVGVDLDQPHFEPLIYHKIQPKHLESEILLLRVHLRVDSPDRIRSNPLHVWGDTFISG